MFETVLRARWVLVDPELPALADGWVALGEGWVAALGQGEPPPAATVTDLGASVLLPGLCLAHTHVDYGALRGHGDGLPFFEWIGTLSRRRIQTMTGERFLESARISVAELAASGVTSVGEATTPGESAVRALAEAGLRAVCFLEVFESDPGKAGDVLADTRARLDQLEALASGTTVRIGLSPHAPYSVSRPLLTGLLELAGERRMAISIHVAETVYEDRFCLDGQGPFADFRRQRGIPVDAPGRRPYRYLAEAGAFDRDEPVLLAHGVRLLGDDLVDLGSRANVHLVHCPRSNARLGCGVAPVVAGRAAGASVLLGSDGACSADRLDPWEEMRAALWLARARAENPAVLPARAVLGMALAGHRALGFGPGRVEPGAPADLIAVTMHAPHWAPHELRPEEVADALVTRTSPSDVGMVLVGGRPVALPEGRPYGRPR